MSLISNNDLLSNQRSFRCGTAISEPKFSILPIGCCLNVDMLTQHEQCSHFFRVTDQLLLASNSLFDKTNHQTWKFLLIFICKQESKMEYGQFFVKTQVLSLTLISFLFSFRGTCLVHCADLCNACV